MIGETDQRLITWLKTIIGSAEVSLALPLDIPTGEGISLYLLSFANHPALRTSKRPPLQILLRYLVTSWSTSPEIAHDLLGQVIFSALQEAEFVVDLDSLSAETWTALKLIPRPSFILSLPLRQERPEPKSQYVRVPLITRIGPTVSLAGRVLGPDDTPIVGALVELPSMQVSHYTDVNGEFLFTALPSEPRTMMLRVRAKGQTFSVSVDQPYDANKPMVIRFDPFGQSS